MANPQTGTPPPDPASKKPSDAPKSKHGGESGSSDPMDDHNDDAIRSIIEASQKQPPPPTQPINTDNGDVYIYDGTLDNYLKSSCTNPTNPLYVNTGGLLVETSQPFYFVNNQPLPSVLTDTDIMKMPTIIVSDQTPKYSNQNISVPVGNSAKKKRNKPPKIAPKFANKQEIDDFICLKASKQAKKISAIDDSVKKEKQVEPVKEALSDASSTSRSAHVRNLDFSSPVKDIVVEKKAAGSTWDEDLRSLTKNCKDKTPTRRRRSVILAKRKSPKKQKKKEDEKKSEERAPPETPGKDMLPKTPGGDELAPPTEVHCTPFNDVLDEHLVGVDLMSIPTPNVPITPGFALTPGEMLGYNHRGTDYSTSSSYYQPSDTEQNKSIDQLIEESRKIDTTCTVNILSDVVIKSEDNITEKNNCHERIKKFNHSVIGKKNLNLLERRPTSSSSDSDSEVEQDKKAGEAEAIPNKETAKIDSAAVINNIISTVEVKTTLEEDRKKSILLRLEEIRLRTIKKMNASPEIIKKPRNSRRTTTRPRRKSTKKDSIEENTDEEAQKLVKGLAQRGIHLIPNKTPLKKCEEAPPPPPSQPPTPQPPPPSSPPPPTPPPPPPPPPPDPIPTFDVKVFNNCYNVTHPEKRRRNSAVKTYNLEVLKKSFKAQLFIEELNREESRTMQWNTLAITDIEPPEKKTDEDDELMDCVITGSIQDSPIKGGRKRKSKFDDNYPTEKRSKSYENQVELLRKVDVDDFLDKVHGD